MKFTKFIGKLFGSGDKEDEENKVTWHRVGDYEDIHLQISTERPKAFDIMGTDVILCKNEDGKLRALRDKCPHQGKKLSHGWCEENKIVCPYHRYSFDLDSGLGSGTGVDTYPLKVEDDWLLIGFERKGLFG